MQTNQNAVIRPDLNLTVHEAFYRDMFFIGDRVFPIWGSNLKLGNYGKERIRSGGLMNASGATDQLRRTPRSAYKRVTGTFEELTFNCVDRGLEEPVDVKEARDIARFLDAEQAAARRVMRIIRTDYEMRIAAKAFNPANYGAALTPSVAYTAANIATLDPVADFQRMHTTLIKRAEMPNALVLSQEMFDRINLSDKLAERMFGRNTAGKAIDASSLAAFLSGLFNKPFQVLIGAAAYNTSKQKDGKSTDAELQYIWSPNYMLMCCIADGAPESGGCGRTVVWQEVSPGLFNTETYEEKDIDSRIIRVHHYTDEIIPNENCGVLMSTGYTA